MSGKVEEFAMMIPVNDGYVIGEDPSHDLMLKDESQRMLFRGAWDLGQKNPDYALGSVNILSEDVITTTMYDLEGEPFQVTALKKEFAFRFFPKDD